MDHKTSAIDETMPKIGRIKLVDMARGLAIIGVIIYHVIWDLANFRLVWFTADQVFYLTSFAKLLVNSFLFLVGVSLVLAHGNGARWTAFWRRWLILAAGAALVSVATYFAFGEGFVYFGVLHAIAVFSLIGLLFLRLPLWLVAAVALAFIVPPNVWQSDVFNQKWLSWIGFWTQHPYTQDLVPFFPGLGTVLAGILLTRVAVQNGLAAKLASWVPSDPVSGLLGWCGRYSLILYLAHQPIAFGLIWAWASFSPSAF